MKPKTLLFAAAFLSATVTNSLGQSAIDDVKLTIGHSTPGLELSWPATFQKSDGSIVRPYFELQRSADLLSWQPMGERQRAAAATPAQFLGVTLGTDKPRAFYRLISVQPQNIAKLGSRGAEVFGYGDAFAHELQRIGQISPDQFAAMFPNGANYLPGLSWDPTSAQYWDPFNAWLNTQELAVFKKNGFVVSERLGGASFAGLFYNLGRSDLPVFISTDALLQAWHRTYDAMLEEIEETYLFNSVQTMLDGMAGHVTAASAEIGNGVLNESLLDADYFLAVARSLLAGTNNPPVPSLLGQDARVAETLADIEAEQFKRVDDFMGFCRMVDFSQFKVRGRYTHTERLGRYFKCVMWLGRIHVPVAGGPWERCPGDVRMASPRELGVAIVLWHLLSTSGQFSSILWTENGVTNKVQRRVPGALDAAFSVLGNDQIVPELVAQMKAQFVDTNRPHAQRFRDGLPYQHNLAAVRTVMDSQQPSAWDSNIYMSWLGCLRDLSAPTTDTKYPEAMRTRAWGMKTLNTQLASWTQLRHDTILYAKQSYTGGGSCVYPTGFVEPRVEFWERLRAMATRAAELIARLRYTGDYQLVTGDVLSLAEIQASQVGHLQNFAGIVSRLEHLATKELRHECFSNEDERFIDGMMEGSRLGEGCGDISTYSGWYPQLFYRTIYWSDTKFHTAYGAGAFDGLVADVHTDVPCDDCGGDPGSVLHEAIGRVNLLMLAVDNGTDRFVCAGPVLSHYEFEVIGDPRRISDEEWRGPVNGANFGILGILQNNFPDDVPASRIEGLSPPEWTRSYLVPAP